MTLLGSAHVGVVLGLIFGGTWFQVFAWIFIIGLLLTMIVMLHRL